MKVANTRKINERICEYGSREELDKRIQDGFIEAIIEDEIVYKDPEGRVENAKHFKKEMMKSGFFHSEDETLIGWAIAGIFEQFLVKQDWGAPVKDDVLKAMVMSGKVFRKGDFDENAYLKNIHFEEQKFGKFEILHDSAEKYEMEVCSWSEKKLNGVSIPEIGIFDNSIEFPLVKKNGEEWRSLNPYEIFTPKQPIKNASGDVLTLGCGLGYYAYMVSEKDEVNSVTIIENDSDVIELFTKYILPQFQHKEKITIIEADEVEYMKNIEDGRFDYCFADLEDDNEVLSYIRLKNICRKFRRTKMDYWDENTILDVIMGYVYFIIMEEASKEKEIPEAQKFTVPEGGQEILDDLMDLLKNEEITRAAHVDYYMDKKNILALMS
jgi:SAM-dependent methyltransferase